MYRQLWSNIHKSVCSLSFLANRDRISSGTGFRVGTKIVTNNHVIQVPSATHVAIRFVQADGDSVLAEKTFPMREFGNRLQDGEAEASWDYAIFDMTIMEFADIPSLVFRADDDVPIGSPIAFLGFQFDQTNLSLHTGVLSSKFVKANVNYLQLDASVNNGNSGGPLILPETGEVIGIVTRKATGLTDQFDGLIAALDNNIKVLEPRSGGVMIGGVDPINALIATQRQLSLVSMEIRRSANVGVGYAYELQRVRDSFVFRE